MHVNIHEAKTHFSKLLRRVLKGEEVTISRAGKPVAKLVPLDRPRAREFGIDQGVFDVPDDFDAPLPEEVLRSFES
jgi:prevent-host-death family protein